MKTQLTIVPVLLLLTACGGSDFTGEPLFGEGTGGATGGATGVTGGVTGVTGGSGSTGGSGGAQTGTGGVLVGTGGDGTGGQQTGTGGVLGGTGGQTATGGATGTCKPPVVTDLSPELPTTIVWDSYLSHVTYIPVDQCLTCLNSPCTTCDVSWYPVTQSADGITITAKASVQCGSMPMTLGACGSTPATCTTWVNSNLYATLTVELVPKTDGTGYTTLYRTQSSTGGVGTPGSCPTTEYNAAVQANQPYWALFDVLRSAVVAIEWPCGG